MLLVTVSLFSFYCLKNMIVLSLCLILDKSPMYQLYTYSKLTVCTIPHAFISRNFFTTPIKSKSVQLKNKICRRESHWLFMCNIFCSFLANRSKKSKYVIITKKNTNTFYSSEFLLEKREKISQSDRYSRTSIDLVCAMSKSK